MYAALYLIDRTRIYRTRFWARASADANGTLYADLRQYTSNTLTAYGPNNSGRSPYKPEAIARHTDWREYDYTWSVSNWQAGATHMQPDILLNYNGTVGYWEVQAYTLTDATDAMRAFALADTANQAAAAAQSTATTANNLVSVIVDDAKLSRDEKPGLTQLVQDITNEYAGILAQATTFAITTEKADYTTYYNALNSYLPAGWNTLGTDTPIVRATFSARFNDYTRFRQVLFNKIANEASKRAVWSGGITGRPEDSALLNSYITLGSDGTLSGAGGGSGVTLSGIGLKNYRVVAKGKSSTTHPTTPGIYQNGSLLVAANRSYVMAVFSRTTGLLVVSEYYDVWGVGLAGGRTANDLAFYLNNLSSANVVVIFSHEEPMAHRFDSGLAAAMYRCGASRAVYGSPNLKDGSAYILIGIPGCGEGAGAEGYQGGVVNDTSAWCDLGFSIVNGNLVGVSSSYAPSSLTDYGYTGDLNASSDITLLNTGMTVAGNKAIKSSGTHGAWDAAVSSKNAYTSGAYCSAVVPDVGPNGLMVGLSTNPLGNTSYDLINYAIYINAGYTFEVYENGVSAGIYGTCAAGDVISVLYDSASVSYMCNNVVKHTHKVRIHNQALYLDTSFRGTGDSLGGIRFGPLSNVYVAPRAGTGTTDNIVPDPQFFDLTWWNRFGHSVQDFTGQGTFWKTGRNLLINPAVGAHTDSLSEWFPTTPGATYRAEFQVFVGDGFNGRLSVCWHIPGYAWHQMGAPFRGYDWSGEALPVAFDINSPKGPGTFSAIVTIPDHGNSSRGQLRIKSECMAGYIEIGSISITRMADAALIPPGAITDAALGLAPFTASIPGGALYGSGPSGSRGYGSRTIVPSGGKAPYTYSWVDANQSNDLGTSQTIKLSNISTATVSAASSGSVTNNVIYCDVVGVVTDASGRTATATFYISQTHGTPP